MDSVRSGPFGQIFRPDNFIFGQVGHSARAAASGCKPHCPTLIRLPTGLAAHRSNTCAV